MTSAEADAEIERRAALLILSDEILGQHPALALLRDALDRFSEVASKRYIEHAGNAQVREEYWELPGVDHELKAPGLRLLPSKMGEGVLKDEDVAAGSTVGAATGALWLFSDLRDKPKALVRVLDRIEEVIQELEQQS